MSSNTGPPSKNTRASTRAAREALEAQNTASRDGQRSAEQGDTTVPPDNTSSHQESSLTSVAVSADDNHSEGKSSSRGGTVREIPDEAADPEPSYTTAPGSFGFASSIGRITSTPFAGGDSSQWRTRDPPPHQTQPDEDWGDIAEAVGDLAYAAKDTQQQADDIAESLEGIKLQSKDILQKLDDIQRRINRKLSNGPQSPREQASIDLFADRHSSEGTEQYARRQSAQSRLRDLRTRPEGGTNPSYYIAGTSARRQAEQNAASHGRLAKEVSRARSNDSPAHDQEKVNDDAGNDPDDESSDASGIEDGPGPGHNPLDQDYARRSVSAQPQPVSNALAQPAVVARTPAQPTVAISAAQFTSLKSKQGQGKVPILMQGYVESEHDRQQIENLRDHIRESLGRTSSNLPELKGVRLKQPEAYEGEDDYDRLEEWLRGLVRFFKLHRLTGADKEDNRVLVAGTCLKGKAGQWFGHEVERTKRTTRYWTFEAVVVGLYHAFITTATAQQAVQRYTRVKFSGEEGVMAFYWELLMWAGRLAQYPDPYSFKRRLFNGLPEEYRRHLALHEHVSAEHSSIDDIVSSARRLEKTLTTMKTVRGPDRPPMQGVVTTGRTGYQRPPGPRERTRPQSQPIRQSSDRANVSSNAQTTRPTTKPATGDCNKTAATAQPTPKGDTSKLTCYKCGKVGHIASDIKCPQYKKLEQRQIYAAQVVDDRSDTDQPDQVEPQNTEVTEEPGMDGADDESREDLPQEDFPDGSQYDDEGPPYDEFDRYDMPSENDEPVYIRAMSDEGEASSRSVPQLDDLDWQSRRDTLRESYQRAPWMYGDSWEFTPRDGITHLRDCIMCAEFKRHLIVEESRVLVGASTSSAWAVRDKYEQELIRIGWDLAHGGGRVPQPEARTSERRVHQLDLLVDNLRRMLRMEEERSRKLADDFARAEVDAFISGKEAKLWCDDYAVLHGQYKALEALLRGRVPTATIPPPPIEADVHMRATASDISDGADSWWDDIVGTSPRSEPPRPVDLDGNINVDSVRPGADTIERMAAARDDSAPIEREFRSAHRHNSTPGERPQTSGSNRRCMAALVKVNGLEAYALLDTGSTTVSITHDFARVAKLQVMQLQNPVPLQLGTVGSRSMINFGAKARLELGPARENDAYMDVVNIDRYDMIVGTPFMRRHGLALDFEKDALTIRGVVIPTLSSGQEDLMLAKKRAYRPRALDVPKGPAHAPQ